MIGSIHELLQRIRKHNGALLGRKSAETLSAYLAGFALARRGSEDSPDDDFLRGFDSWVHRRFRTDSTQGWARIIASYCNDGPEELDLFWKLYDQYMARHRTARRPARTNSHAPQAKKTG
jgi:hypothetical protein